MKTLEKIIIVLVQILVDTKREMVSLFTNRTTFDKNISGIKYGIEAKIESSWNNRVDKLDQIFAVIDVINNNNS